MRYEFERDGTVVASVCRERSGRIDVVATEPTVRAVVDGCLSTDVAAAAASTGSRFDYPREPGSDALRMHRREWTPWEFERACRTLGRRLGARIHRTMTEEAIAR